MYVVCKHQGVQRNLFLVTVFLPATSLILLIVTMNVFMQGDNQERSNWRHLWVGATIPKSGHIGAPKHATLRKLVHFQLQCFVRSCLALKTEIDGPSLNSTINGV